MMWSSFLSWIAWKGLNTYIHAFRKIMWNLISWIRQWTQLFPSANCKQNCLSICICVCCIFSSFIRNPVVRRYKTYDRSAGCSHILYWSFLLHISKDIWWLGYITQARQGGRRDTFCCLLTDQLKLNKSCACHAICAFISVQEFAYFAH